jgi:hypothetical protein
MYYRKIVRQVIYQNSTQQSYLTLRKQQSASETIFYRVKVVLQKYTAGRMGLASHVVISASLHWQNYAGPSRSDRSPARASNKHRLTDYAQCFLIPMLGKKNSCFQHGQDKTPQLSAGKHRPNTTLTPLNTELNPMCHLLTLLGSHQILNVSRLRVKLYHGSQFATEFKEGQYTKHQVPYRVEYNTPTIQQLQHKLSSRHTTA